MTELVGKGKPFHSALDRALASLPEKASPEQVVNHLLKLGVKPQELIDRRMDQAIGAPLIPRERTVKLKNPDNKGRTEIVEPYFETTSVKGAKSIPRSMVAELASKNPAPAIHEKVLGKISDSEFFQKANEIAEDYYGVPYGKLNHEEQMRIDKVVDEDTSHHRGLTLPGGENYREMLIKAPEGMEGFKGVGSHFGGEPDILASMRLKDRKGPNGEKLLHLEELQSDWHQKGRENGYKESDNSAKIASINKQINDESKEFQDLTLQIFHAKTDAEKAPLLARQKEIGNNYQELKQTLDKEESKNINGVPDAPFKKNWEEMALKRLIHHAAEKGYHGIVAVSYTHLTLPTILRV